MGKPHGGVEALSLCEQARTDVLLVAMMMSGMEGIETTKAIRERDSIGSFPCEV
jgi:CheY-like chemotaxis protein